MGIPVPTDYHGLLCRSGAFHLKDRLLYAATAAAAVLALQKAADPTWPTPIWKTNGCPLSRDESNLLPSVSVPV